MPNYEDEYGAIFGLNPPVPEQPPVAPPVIEQPPFVDPVGVLQPDGAVVEQERPIAPPPPPEPQLPQRSFQEATRRQGGSYVVDQNAASNNALVATEGQASAIGDLAGSAVRQGENERAVNAVRVEQREEANALNQEFLAQQEVFQQEARDRSEQRLNAIQASVEKAASHRVEAGRLWNTDFGTKATGIFAAFVGGFMSPVLGKNDIQGILDRGIERDINSQKYEGQQLDKSKENLIKLDGLFENKEEQQAAERSAMHLARQSNLINEFEAQVQRLQDPIIKEKAVEQVAKLKLNLTERISQEQSKQVQIASQSANNKSQMLRARMQAGAAAARQKRDQAFKREMMDKKNAADLAKAKAKAAGGGGTSAFQVRSRFKSGLVHGELPQDLSDGERKEFNNAVDGVAEAAEGLREVMQLRAKYGKFYNSMGKDFFNTEGGQRLKRAYAKYEMALIKAQSGAQVNAEEMKRLRAAIPPPSFMTRNHDELWEDEVESIGKKGERYYNKYGLNTNALYEELTAYGKPAGQASKASLQDALDQAQTDEAPFARVNAIEDLTTQLEHNETTVGRPELQERAKEALDYVQKNGSFKEKKKAKRAYGAFQKAHKDALNKVNGVPAKPISGGRSDFLDPAAAKREEYDKVMRLRKALGK